MVAVPMAIPVTSPPAVTEAIVASELDQPTEEPLRVFELPSEYRAVAISWTVLVVETVAVGGVTNIELIVGLMKKPVQPQLTQSSNAKPAVSPKRILAAKEDCASLRFIATIEVNPFSLRRCRGRNKFSRISIRHVECSTLYTQYPCSCCSTSRATASGLKADRISAILARQQQASAVSSIPPFPWVRVHDSRQSSRCCRWHILLPLARN